MRGAPVDVVLFDLGGVLVDFAGVDTMKALAGIDSDDELWRRWLSCPWVRRFERGQCAADEFAAGMVVEWDLTIAPDEFLAGFRVWPGRVFPGAEQLVADTRAVVPVGCLSNTNALHWDHYGPRWQDFDFQFLSFELGAVKPDREIFDHVAVALGAPRDRVLFLDDNVINVDAAGDAGFRAARAVGVDEARTVLVDLGVLPRDGRRGTG
jgi:putative hydrolase of the HAD superfamily